MRNESFNCEERQRLHVNKHIHFQEDKSAQLSFFLSQRECSSLCVCAPLSSGEWRGKGDVGRGYQCPDWCQVRSLGDEGAPWPSSARINAALS